MLIFVTLAIENATEASSCPIICLLGRWYKTAFWSEESTQALAATVTPWRQLGGGVFKTQTCRTLRGSGATRNSRVLLLKLVWLEKKKSGAVYSRERASDGQLQTQQTGWPTSSTRMGIRWPKTSAALVPNYGPLMCSSTESLTEAICLALIRTVIPIIIIIIITFTEYNAQQTLSKFELLPQ